jgi:hypothetical protein
VLIAIDAGSGARSAMSPLAEPPTSFSSIANSSDSTLPSATPGVVDVIDIGTMRREEVLPTEAGAHTLAIDRKRNKLYAFLPATHRAAVFVNSA